MNFNQISILTLLPLFLFIHTAKGQFEVQDASTTEYYSSDFLRLSNHSYKSNVKTVMLHPSGWPLALPILQLNQEEALELHFDVLDSTIGNYMYSFIHCDHNWEKSNLDPQEYLEGPADEYLNDYTYSRNTYQRYIHYSLEIPNYTTRITKSGNYVLMVYEDGNRENLILTRRFCVVEPNSPVAVDINVHQATRVKERYTHQEVDFSIKLRDYPMTNPYTDLKVVVIQNHTWESALLGLSPRFVKDNELDYNYDGENTFEGLNEFRLLDIADTRFPGRGVKTVSYTNRQNHAYLELDKSRSAITYLQNPDINGWFYIKNDNPGTDGSVDSDYINTHFALSKEKALSDGDIYIYGALTDWKIIPEAKMKYNQLALQYEADMYLKQGLYNFLYVFVKDGSLKPDMTALEGSHYETENEYTILIYHRPFGWDYDKLIGVSEFKYSNN